MKKTFIGLTALLTVLFAGVASAQVDQTVNFLLAGSSALELTDTEVDIIIGANADLIGDLTGALGGLLGDATISHAGSATTTYGLEGICVSLLGVIDCPSISAQLDTNLPTGMELYVAMGEPNILDLNLLDTWVNVSADAPAMVLSSAELTDLLGGLLGSLEAGTLTYAVTLDIAASEIDLSTEPTMFEQDGMTGFTRVVTFTIQD